MEAKEECNKIILSIYAYNFCMKMVNTARSRIYAFRGSGNFNASDNY
jgi:hypothetical protein